MTSAELLSQLVRIPSVNPMGRTWPSSEWLYESRLTDFLQSLIASWGVQFERTTVAPARDNLVVRLPATSTARTILFEVHQDTVPVEGMTIEPFAGEIRDGKLYGRGACDVKGSMTAMLLALKRLIQEKPANRANLIIAFTVDEEHTFLGVQRLMQSGIRADFAIVAEPTNLNIVDAHKGVVRWKVRTPGKAGHSSRPDCGINAIYRMGHLLQSIESYADALMRLPPDPRLGTPTLSVGRIEGGASVNTIPDFCTIDIDRRLMPGESAQQAYADFQMHMKEHSSVPFECLPIYLNCPSLTNQRNQDLALRFGQVIDSVRGTHEVFAVPFGTDASTIGDTIPAVVFGPGDIAQAHTCDEWIDLAQIDTAAEILFRLVAQG